MFLLLCHGQKLTSAPSPLNDHFAGQSLVRIFSSHDKKITTAFLHPVLALEKCEVMILGLLQVICSPFLEFFKKSLLMYLIFSLVWNLFWYVSVRVFFIFWVALCWAFRLNMFHLFFFSVWKLFFISYFFPYLSETSVIWKLVFPVLISMWLSFSFVFFYVIIILCCPWKSSLLISYSLLIHSLTTSTL